MIDSIKDYVNKGYSFILNYSTAQVTMNKNSIEIYSETLRFSVIVDKDTNGTLVNGHWTWYDGEYGWELIAYEEKKW